MLRKHFALIALAIVAMNAAQALSEPADTLSGLWRSLSTCVRVPNEDANSEITIVFALKRDGSLLGQPRITHSRLLGDADAQKAFVEDAVRALAKCLPVSITDGLGGAIAGRPLSIRIGKRPKETET